MKKAVVALQNYAYFPKQWYVRYLCLLKHEFNNSYNKETKSTILLNHFDINQNWKTRKEKDFINKIFSCLK